MSELSERIKHKQLLAKVMPVEESVKWVRDRDVLAVSGFTKSGEPKPFLPALAKHLSQTAPETRIALLSGASLSEQVEGPLAPFIKKRGPYMSSAASRLLIHAGKMDFSDVHLSAFSRNLMYGFYGEIDLAVIEVSGILEDGTAVLTSSVGVSVEALHKAKKIIFEVNTACPDYTGFHDLLVPTVYPKTTWPLPILNVSDRIGSPFAQFDPSKVVAVVESKTPDYPVPFKPTSEVERKIAANVIDFLMKCNEWFSWKNRLPPIQSGVGNIANAIVGELLDSPFHKLRFWTEVFQDGILRCMDEAGKLDYASATAVSFSAQARQEFARRFETCRECLVLRPMWVSNSPEVITRLFVIAMNTPIEIDIYGHVNSTHLTGTKLVNGVGGSGDFLRNAYISIIHPPSVRKLKDGRTVSSIMPYVRHIDPTEHNVNCVITEHGYALNTAIRSPRKRAEDIISHCAHPHFRPLLREYMKLSGDGDEPRAQDLSVLKGWWEQYHAACLSFPS